MTTDALRAAIESEGRARVAAIFRAAEEEAKQVREAAAARARQRQHDALHSEELELRRRASLRTLAARTEARKRVFEAREDLLDRVFARAEQVLSRELQAPAARGWQLARLERALGYVRPEAEVVVLGSSGVAPWLQEELEHRENLRVECDPDLPTGFRVEADGGALVVDVTLPRLLDADRPVLAIGVLQQLREEWEAGA